MFRLTLLFAGLLIGLAASEIVLRIVSPVREENILPFPFKSEELRRISEGDAYIRFDALLGWSATESSARRDGKITYQTNSAGMRRDREASLQPDPAVIRLAAFGDSFTFCDEVNNADCWTSQLERRWAGVEVLNFGVPAFGPDQAWLRYQRDGAAYQPCAVLIGYMVENIHRVVNRYRPFYRPETGVVLSKPRFIWDGQELSLLPNPAASPDNLWDMQWVDTNLGPSDAWFYPGMFQTGPLDALRTVRMAKTIAYQRRSGHGPGDGDWSKRLGWAYQEDQEGFQVAARVLSSFAQDVRNHGSTPVVVLFGRKEEVEALRDTKSKAHAPLLQWLARENIAAIDTTDSILRQSRSSGVDAMYDKHFTPRGNRVVAETLASELPPLIAPTCTTR